MNSQFDVMLELDELQRYRHYKPTACDPAGLNCPDMQDWIVMPCGHNRDSETLTESNWTVQYQLLAEYGTDGEDFFEASFGHWACGWFAIMLVNPDSWGACFVAAKVAASIADYPVLDEMHWSEAECDAHSEGLCDEHCSMCEGDEQDYRGPLDDLHVAVDPPHDSHELQGAVIDARRACIAFLASTIELECMDATKEGEL